MTESVSEREIVRLLAEGPLTGAELVERTRLDALPLWQACRGSPAIRIETVGRRYLRLDRAVEGYARLSPSIRREFLTYAVLGLAADPQPAREKAARLSREIESISLRKFELAREAMESVVAELSDRDALLAGACFIVAGDITYGMSHVVDRPETSTGKMVRGSDLDIIVIGTDELPDQALAALDDAIYRKKHFLLTNPGYREEIDYVIKRMARVREQLRFDNFRSMIACKIMWEGQYLLGSEDVFNDVKALVEEHGIPGRLAELETRAVAAREQAEITLLAAAAGAAETADMGLFFTAEEGDEIS